MTGLVVAVFVASTSLSQVQGAQQWTFVTAQGQLSRVRYNFEVHLRARLLPQPLALAAVQISPALGVNLGGDVSVWAAYSRFEQVDRSRPSENRLWQQVLFDRDTDLLRFVMRVRFEERFFVTLSSPAVRLRVLVRGSVPLPVETFRLLAQSELFVHVLGAPGIVSNGFDQTRTQVSVQWRPVEWLTAELGYMLQITASLALSHNLVAALTFRLPKWNPFDEQEIRELPVPQG
ncbi:MAG: DUF2490 domain-containing protein [Myxococcaceae bacterium]|nr:DUF2490 domain-containing protein [Myxococcaceae bacterium]